MTSAKHNNLSYRILTSFALMTAIILELVGSFVPEIIHSRSNATSVSETNAEYDMSYSLWTRKVCERSFICDKTQPCQRVGINSGSPVIVPSIPVCETSIYFPADSDEIADVLVWGKKIQMPSVLLGLIGFFLYEYSVFMFVDCPHKNRRTVKRLACLFSLIAGVGSWICVVIISSWTLKSSDEYQLGWALVFPIIGGAFQFVFTWVGWYFDRYINDEAYIDTVKKVRTPRKIRFEDEPSLQSETELLPFDII